MKGRESGDSSGAGRAVKRAGGASGTHSQGPSSTLEVEREASDATGEALSDLVWEHRQALLNADLGGMDDGERLGLLRQLEDLGRTMSAVSTRVMVDFQASQVAIQARAGIPVSKRGRAVPDDLATARKTSPYWGSRQLTMARALVNEMPFTYHALRDGVINEYQARLVAEATACLSVEDRAEVDQRLAPRLVGATNREIEAASRALAYEVDPAGFVARARKAAKDRGVSLRPAPDVMGILSARLPAPMAIACYAALKERAIAGRALGDPRSEQQLMADELFFRLTGRTVVDGVDVEVGVVITDEALFGGDSTSADLLGYGPIPAETARDLLRPDEGDGANCGVDAGDDGDGEPEPAGGAGPRPGSRPGSGPEGRGGADPSQTASGFCPAAGRCTDFDCTLIHGATPAPQPPAYPPGLMGQPDTRQQGGAGVQGGGGDVNPGEHDHQTAESSGSGQPDRGGPGEPEDAGPGEPEDAGPGEPADAGPGEPEVAGSGNHEHAGQGEPERAAAPKAAKVWLRRLYADPVTGTLTTRDPRRRLFTGALRQFLIARDRTCRNSWCGAPIRHIDHISPHADQGLTEEDNGRGLCIRCNVTRERDRCTTGPPTTFRPPPPVLDGLPGRAATSPSAAPSPHAHRSPARAESTDDDGDPHAA